MKSAINGGLQLSILDGWWAEGYDGMNGWGLSGEVDADHRAQDERHAHEFNRAVADEVVPLFYDRRDDGLSGGWIERMKASLRTLAPQFSATRMVQEYVDDRYLG
jgi:starch phosphorylase